MKNNLKKFLKYFKKSKKSSDYKALSSSFLFDKEWYLLAYPDVATAKLDPISHYLKHGAFEGREPGPVFDSFYYLSQVSSLPKEQQIVENPLLHYLYIGETAGLRPALSNRVHKPVKVSYLHYLVLKFRPFYRYLSLFTERYFDKTLLLPELEPIKPLPLRVLVITWDVGHNPLGRSYMISKVLERVVSNVVLCGFQFSHFGDDIWKPLRESDLPVIVLPGGNIGEWLASCEGAVKKYKPDVVIACKPRMPSVELGILFKEKYGIPLIVDVDDHELSFFNNSQAFTLEDVNALSDEFLCAQNEPFSEVWTRLTDSLVRCYADEIITSNVALDRAFGGTLIPHVRDELAFDSSLYSKQEQRLKYGIPNDAKVVMFFGTLRAHKGLEIIAKAIGNIKDSNAVLVVVGDTPDNSISGHLDTLANEKIVFLPSQPFSAIPEIIVMADLIVLPMEINHPISKFQLPAKAIDAIGMNIPLIVSGTEPLMQLVTDGVAKLLPTKGLQKVIESELYKTYSKFDHLSVRKQFLLKYSYYSAALQLKKVIEKALKSKRKPLDGFNELKQLQKRLFPVLKSSQSTQGVDIVVFWKQNDTGLYGRRSDMVIKYLAGRDDVRKVVVFDAPISEFDVSRLKGTDSLTQNRNIYIKVYEKLLCKLDTSKISYNVFEHSSEAYTLHESENGSSVSFLDAYKTYIQSVLDSEDVQPNKAVFWFYPKIPLAEQLVDFFKPEKLVVDVVDDHRSWPNVSYMENKWLTEHYKSLLGRADLAMANCQPVIDSMNEFNQNIRLIPNGCEEFPTIIEPKNHAMYDELKTFKGKVIGFVGNLEAKIDISLIEKIAVEFKDELIVLVGSTHTNPLVRALQKYSNVRMFGVVPYENMNAIVEKFDVGIVPHKKMDMTDNMNPLKVFVYLLNKVPVVATEVKNLPNESAVISVNGEVSFIKALHHFIDEPIKHKFDFLNNYTWRSRLSEPVDELLDKS